MSAASHLTRLTSRRPSGHRPLVVVGIVLAVIGLAVALGLRTVQGGATSSAGSVGSTAPALGAQGAGSGADAGPGTGARAPAAGPGTSSATEGAVSSTVVLEARIARSAWLGIKVTDPTGAAARARFVATGAGGQVTSEDVVTSLDPTGGATAGSSRGSTGGPTGDLAGQPPADPRGRSGASVPSVGVNEARMVLSVPAKALDEVLTELSRIGTVSYRSSQSQDVTDSYVDTKARIEPMRAGIDRIRALLAKSTDLQQVITLESELSRRQADLDSLTQRLAQLDAMTTTSDVTVSLWTDATEPVQSDSGVSGGLRTAWEGLLGSLTVIMTGLAVLLPWLVLLVPLTLLGVRLWRGRGATGPALPTPAAPPTPTPATSAPGSASSSD